MFFNKRKQQEEKEFYEMLEKEAHLRAEGFQRFKNVIKYEDKIVQDVLMRLYSYIVLYNIKRINDVQVIPVHDYTIIFKTKDIRIAISIYPESISLKELKETFNKTNINSILLDFYGN
jgi:hypothetical protein